MLTEASAAPSGQATQGVTTPWAQRDVGSWILLHSQPQMGHLREAGAPHVEPASCRNTPTAGLVSWQMAAAKGA